MIVAAAHQMQIGRRQDRHCDTGIGQLGGDRSKAIRRQQRHLRGVPDRDAAAPAIFLGLAADIFDLHAVSGLGEIEMHVDLGIVFARDGEDAIDLAARVAVEIRRRADRARAAAQALDQQLVGAGIVDQPLLRKHAEFDIDAPGVVTRQLLDRVEADHADTRIELDMGAHMHGTVADAALERLFASRENILDGELLFGRRGDPHRLGDRALLDMAAIHDAGLVEMDMGLDHAGHHEAAPGVELRRVGAETGGQCCDPGALNADINDGKRALMQDAGVTNDQIHYFTIAGWTPEPTLRQASSRFVSRNAL